MKIVTSKNLKSIKRYPVVTVDVAVTAADALALAQSSGVHHLPVTEDGALVGLVCTCDLYEVSPTQRVRQAMSSPPVTLEESESARTAAEIIKGERIGSIVVVDTDGSPSGIVTRGDLLQSDDTEAQELLEDCRCICCGLTRHLRTDARGQLLCMYCHERASDGSWLDLGDGD